MSLTRADLKVGRVYSAKRPAQGYGLIYDRVIVHIDLLGTVQYDGPSVANGRHYPRVPAEKFLAWADEDITDKMPPGEWRPAR